MLHATHTSAPLVRADVLSLPLPDSSVDGATCGFALRNLVDLRPFFEELARVVRPGGRIGLLEVAEPTNTVLRAGHHLYFTRVVPRIGAALSDGRAYRYLPRSVAYLPGVDALVREVAAAGFPDVVRQTLSGGVVQLLVGTRA
jgi:demethylmenaquinone methyltransferase/2-methoxy-6-polyprenyl-1,4-benzoquinol methylase